VHGTCLLLTSSTLQTPASGAADRCTFDQLPGLLAASDIVVLALPLSAQSRSLIDAAALAHLRPTRCWSISAAAGWWIRRR